jgi:catalase
LQAAIEKGDYPKWRVMVQVMPEKDAESYAIHPFDLTKVWPHKDYPRIEVGIMELNRNPENYFAEVEQAAFEPGNAPPGMGASPDKMLQARLLSYPDAHRYRIGINYAALPVNKPRCPMHSYHRDGQTRFDGNGGDSPVYQPNSFNGPVEDPGVKEPPLRINGDADRYDHWAGNADYWTQAGNLFRLMSAEEKVRLIGNLVGAMQGVPRDIQLRQVRHFYKADPAYGEGVAKGLGIDVKEVKAA